MRETIAGSTGIAVIIAATLVSCLAMSVTTGTWFQWVLCGLGIFGSSVSRCKTSILRIARVPLESRPSPSVGQTRHRQATSPPSDL